MLVSDSTAGELVRRGVSTPSCRSVRPCRTQHTSSRRRAAASGRRKPVEALDRMGVGSGNCFLLLTAVIIAGCHWLLSVSRWRTSIIFIFIMASWCALPASWSTTMRGKAKKGEPTMHNNNAYSSLCSISVNTLQPITYHVRECAVYNIPHK